MIIAIQEFIDARCLPFPAWASEGSGAFFTLTIRVRNPRDGRESAEHVSFPAPKDPVLLDGLGRALNKMITRGNMAEHIGLEVF